MAESAHIAGIDAGSNGIRLIIAQLRNKSEYKIVHAERACVRLGQDAFGKGSFREETLRKASKTFAGFRKTLDQYHVIGLRAVATSAARESENTDVLASAIEEASGIELEVIDGLEEAKLMFGAINANRDLKGQRALLIDMGGGSVEVTVAVNGGAVGAETLPLGPVRLMCQLRSQKLAETDVDQLLEPHAYAVENLIHAELAKKKLDVAFGAGGNLDALGELRRQLLGKSKTYKIKIGDLESMIPLLLALSVEERQKKLGLRSDRADVIAIAAVVLHALMDEADIPRIILPGLGIKDGILRQLAKECSRITSKP